MSEYLSKEEIKQWRSSLERITLEEFAARLGKKIEEAKPTNDLVDIVLHGQPVKATTDEDYLKTRTERITTIAQLAYDREQEISPSPFSITKLKLNAQDFGDRKVGAQKSEVSPDKLNLAQRPIISDIAKPGESLSAEKVEVSEKTVKAESSFEVAQPIKKEKVTNHEAIITEEVSSKEVESTKEIKAKPVKSKAAKTTKKVSKKSTGTKLAKAKKEVLSSKKTGDELLDDVRITFKKVLTQREQLVFNYFKEHRNEIVYAKDLATLLELPRDYVYKYIKNLRTKIEGEKLKNADKGGFILNI